MIILVPRSIGHIVVRRIVEQLKDRTTVTHRNRDLHPDRVASVCCEGVLLHQAKPDVMCSAITTKEKRRKWNQLRLGPSLGCRE